MTTEIVVRNTTPADFPGVIELTREVYPQGPPWSVEQLASHQRVFPEGQFVAVGGDRVVGMAAGLVIRWDEYAMDATWRDFTERGMFTNHDPANGHTLYAAEIMVRPAAQGTASEANCTSPAASSSSVWACGASARVPACADTTSTRPR